MNVVASKLNTPEEWEALSGNCVSFLFFRVTTTVGDRVLWKLSCSCYLLLSKGIAYISLFYFHFFFSLTVINISFFIKHNQSMHHSRGDFLNMILYLQHIVNHHVKMEAHAWPEISAPAHMVLWDRDVIQVSKRE